MVSLVILRIKNWKDYPCRVPRLRRTPILDAYRGYDEFKNTQASHILPERRAKSLRHRRAKVRTKYFIKHFLHQKPPPRKQTPTRQSLDHDFFLMVLSIFITWMSQIWTISHFDLEEYFHRFFSMSTWSHQKFEQVKVWIITCFGLPSS